MSFDIYGNRLRAGHCEVHPHVHQAVPNPGSDEAVEQGCICPVLDNAHGRGALGSSGENAIFCRRKDCPLHGTKEKK